MRLTGIIKQREGVLSQKTCRKCGHVAAFEGAEPLACSECGAVYAKVEAAMRAVAEARAARGAPVASPRVRAAPPAPGARSERDDVDVHAFAERMRGESLYPAWRNIVGIFTMFGYGLAIIFLIGGLVAAFKGSVAAGVIGMCIALLMAVVAKVSKELSLMLADLSDASVRMAAQRES